MQVAARVVEGDAGERIVTPFDVVTVRVDDGGDIGVAEYRSEDRVGPPAHRHPWHEVECVLEGEVEFLVDGAWRRLGPGGVQLLPAGEAHSVRVPSGSARVLMVTVGAPYAPFARELAEAAARGAGVEEIVAVAGRHGVTLADVPPAEAPTPPAASADEIVAEYAAAWGRGAPEEAWAYYADDVVMRLPGRSALAGVHQGRAAVVAALDAFLARTGGAPPEVHVVDRLVSGSAWRWSCARQ